MLNHFFAPGNVWEKLVLSRGVVVYIYFKYFFFGFSFFSEWTSGGTPPPTGPGFLWSGCGWKTATGFSSGKIIISFPFWTFAFSSCACVCSCVFVCARERRCPQRPEVSDISGTGLRGDHEQLDVVLGADLSSCARAHMLLTVEPSLHSQLFHCLRLGHSESECSLAICRYILVSRFCPCQHLLWIQMVHGVSKGGSMRLWGWIPEGTRAWLESYSRMWLCMACNTCTLEAEAGKFQYWGHPRLYSKILYQNQTDKQTVQQDSLCLHKKVFPFRKTSCMASCCREHKHIFATDSNDLEIFCEILSLLLPIF